MKSQPLWMFGIPITALAIMMGITNPKPDAYSQYASNRLVKQGEKLICEKTKQCKAGETPEFVTNMAKKAIKPLVDKSSQRQNYLLFSLYSTDIPTIGQVKTLGILGQFLTYSEPK